MDAKEVPSDDSAATAEPIQQVYLAGKGLSGVGIRFRALSAEQMDAVVLAAAQSVGPNATNIQLMQAEHRFGIDTMLVSIKPPQATAWRPYTPGCYPWSAKERNVLQRIYNRENSVTQDELEAIMGKAQAVST